MADKAAAAGTAIADDLQDSLLHIARRSSTAAEFLRQSLDAIIAHEPLIERTVHDALVASYLKAWQPSLKLFVPPEPPEPGLPQILPPELPPPFGPAAAAAGEPEPLVRYPLIERAARNLVERRVMTRPEFDRLSLDARREAFTVARVQSLDTLDSLRNHVAEAAAQGKSFREFQEQAVEALAETPLSPAHLENVYRTNMASAYSAGQHALLDHPLIADEFPYVLWTAIHDDRVRPDHLQMEQSGLNGTAVFRRDDPLLRQVWPPAGYNCRCHVIPLQLEDAAKLGVKEASAWLESGEPPTVPQHVKSVPIILPIGWAPSARLAAVA